MKNLKKLAVLLLALVMVFGLATVAFADETAPTGSITIKDADNVSVAGKTFNAYKILDLKLVGEDDPNTTDKDERGYVYTVPDGLKDFYATEFKIDKTVGDFDAQVVAKIAAMKDKPDELFAFAAKALAAAKKAGITPGTATGGKDADEVKIDKLSLGYYVIEDAGTATPISALMLQSTNPNVEVTIKADKPSVDKNIDGKTDTDPETKEMVKYNNTSIGDKVPYVVTSKVPDMTGYTKYYFVMNDTLSKGLTFNNDVAITIGSKTLVKDTDYTVTSSPVYEKNADGSNKLDSNNQPIPTGETAVEIIFHNFIQYKDAAYKNADITITYSATVNESAVIGVEGNPNKVTLTYSNNPNTDESGNPSDKPGPNSPTGVTPESETRTYVTEIELIKVDDKGGNRLTGAEFQIEGTRLNTVLVKTESFTEAENGEYWKLKTGEYTKTPPVTAEDETDTSKLYESTTTKYTKTTTTHATQEAEDVKYTATVGADGTLKFTGLAAGDDYTIKEIKAPAGYNLLKQPINVTIGWTAPTAPSTDCTWTYSWDIKDGDKVISSGATAQITVVNKTGSELPSTGGTGTTIFYVLGAVLTLGAAVLLITKRRMNAR